MFNYIKILFFFSVLEKNSKLRSPQSETKLENFVLENPTVWLRYLTFSWLNLTRQVQEVKSKKIQALGLNHTPTFWVRELNESELSTSIFELKNPNYPLLFFEKKIFLTKFFLVPWTHRFVNKPSPHQRYSMLLYPH